MAGVAPATTAAAMSLLARLCRTGRTGRPRPSRVTRRGGGSTLPLVERLSVWGNRAAARNNEGAA